MSIFIFDKETLLFKKSNKLIKYRIIVYVLLFSVFLLSFVAIKTPKKEYIETEIKINIDTKTAEKEIFKRIDELPFKYKDIIKAQALIESSHFKSAVFKHNNNVFGMKLARQRITLATGDNLNHATFRSIEESILDRLIYESKYMSNLSKEQYFSFLDKLYAEGDGYSTKLKQIIKNNNF